MVSWLELSPSGAPFPNRSVQIITVQPVEVSGDIKEYFYAGVIVEVSNLQLAGWIWSGTQNHLAQEQAESGKAQELGC